MEGPISVVIFYIYIYHIGESDDQTDISVSEISTVLFLNFGTPETFAVIYLKFKQSSQTLRYCVKIMQME